MDGIYVTKHYEDPDARVAYDTYWGNESDMADAQNDLATIKEAVSGLLIKVAVLEAMLDGHTKQDDKNFEGITQQVNATTVSLQNLAIKVAGISAVIGAATAALGLFLSKLL